MFFSRRAGLKFIPRGDPESFDFGAGDFTQDSTWRVLDISGVVPVNAKWIYCRFTGTAMNAAHTFNFRPAGNSNDVNAARIQQKVIGTIPDRTFWMPVTSAGELEYSNGGGEWVIANLAILAWIV